MDKPPQEALTAAAEWWARQLAAPRYGPDRLLATAAQKAALTARASRGSPERGSVTAR